MKLLFVPILFIAFSSQAQIDLGGPLPQQMSAFPYAPEPAITGGINPVEIRVQKKNKWKLTKNKILTGSLVFTSGLAKGFNEALQYKYNGFEEIFPRANDQWFYPTFSYNNKYKNNNPAMGPKFPFSTSLLVMFTDQYHLNNFIHRASLTAALILKIGEGKKPLKHYLLDALYYTACYQVGFHAIHAPISARNKM